MVCLCCPLASFTPLGPAPELVIQEGGFIHTWRDIGCGAAKIMRRFFSSIFGGESGATPNKAARQQKQSHPSRRQQQQQQQQQAAHAASAGEQRSRVTTSDDLRARSPVVRERPALDGGTQGLSSQTLLVDADGDEANEFLVVDEPPGR